MRRLSVRVLPALLLGLSLGLLLDGQETTPASGFPLRTFFSVRSALPDDTIPDILREQFEKDDGSPLRSVAVDLDGDGGNEKFVLCGVPRVSGGYQWLVYDVARGVGRGIVVGTIIFIGQERDVAAIPGSSPTGSRAARCPSFSGMPSLRAATAGRGRGP